MRRKRKVTYTIYVDERDDAQSIGRKLTARRIRAISIRKGERMSDWADDLGVTRQYISQVVNGKRRAQDIRGYIEKRLGQTFWPERKEVA
jgi:hypothetical protein